MYRALAVMSLDYEFRQLKALPVWEAPSGFSLASAAYDGQQALERLRQEHFDLVLTEINLPLLDGLQLLRRIREENLCPVVVVLSSTVNFQHIRECILYGAFDFLEKMPDSDTLSKLLRRANLHLLQTYSRKDSPEQLPGEDPAFQQDEDAIVQGLLAQREQALQVFSYTMDAIYDMNQSNPIKADFQVRQLFRNIINRVFEQMNWLHLYTDVSSFHRPNFIRIDSRIHTEEVYLHKLTGLYQLISALHPSVADPNIRHVIEYTLSHPEEQLTLRQLASELFMNYSYLSNKFAALTGQPFSKYVTYIRMTRAAFLLRHSTLRIGEISAALNYKDTNYFSRQFKAQYDMTPRRFREIERAESDSIDSAAL